MTGKISLYIAAAMLFFFVPACLCAETMAEKSDHLALTGKITNPRGKGLKDARIEILLNGNVLDLRDGLRSSDDGTFETDMMFVSGVLDEGKLEMRVSNPSFRTVGPVAIQHVLRDPECRSTSGEYLAYSVVELPRAITAAFWIATFVLVAVYVIIALELMHRSLVSLFGAAFILFISYTAGTFFPDFFILSFDDAIQAIDFKCDRPAHGHDDDCGDSEKNRGAPVVVL